MKNLYKANGKFYRLEPGHSAGNLPAGMVKVKARSKRAFPNRFDWQCPTCGRWVRYYEGFCQCESDKL
jgi:hypothetical protein